MAENEYKQIKDIYELKKKNGLAFSESKETLRIIQITIIVK